MRVELIAMTPNAENICAAAACVCTNTTNHDNKVLEHVIASGHTSVLEHAVFTFYVKGLSRAALAQLTRHRLASFNVQSQRYVRIKGLDLVIPKSIKDSELYEEVMSLMENVMDLYQRMVDAGIPKEDARYVTPQSVPTTLVMTMNARELLHFFSLRSCNRAQWEIRALSDKMLRACKDECPVIFKNAGPGCVRKACPEARPCGHPRSMKDGDLI